MTIGTDQFLTFRPGMRDRYIALPFDCHFTPDDPNGGTAWFVGLDGNRIPTFTVAAGALITSLIARHEMGHESEAQLVARGMTTADIRQRFWTRRGFPGTAASQQADVDAGLYGPPGSMGNWQNLPGEMIAESFRCAMEGPNEPNRSAGNPGRTMDWGLTIQHAAELAWWQQMMEDVVLKVFVSPDLAVPLDANGDTPKPYGQVITIPPNTLSPGVVAMGFANRIGFAGTEAVIGTATFVPDTNGTSGRLHVRGAEPRGGTAYYRVSAEQKV